MKIVSSADLGGLGATEGAAIVYPWLPPSTLPQALPWLALPLLLLPRQNRSGQVLWLGLPLLTNLELGWLISITPMGFVGGEKESFRALYNALTLGLAAVWLASPYLNRPARLLTYLSTLMVMVAFGLLAAAIPQPWDDENQRMILLISVAVFGAVLVLALHLAGWSCRGRFGAVRFLARLLPAIVACWIVAASAVSLFAGAGPLWEMTKALLIATTISVTLLLPFLVVSFCSSFFRDRFKQMLYLS